MSDDEDDYVVTNLDDGSKYSVEEVTKKFNIVKVSSSDAKQGAQLKYGEEEEEDRNYFDATQNSLSLTQTQTETFGTYKPLSVPSGGRLTFARIPAVGMSRDEDDKAYSVFYLDVRCNVASPSSWFVYRRYSQFRRLSDVLRSEGYSVPILPSKKLLGTFSPEFIKQRRADLESWLYNLAEMHVTHPGAKDVQGQSYYRKFLTEDANKPPLPLKRIYPENTEVAPAKGEADFDDMGLMGESGKVKVSIDDFDLVKVIGKGSFGKVTLVRKKTDKKLYAMKVLNKADIVKRKQVEHTRTERRVLGSINHPFIVRLHYAFQTEEKLYFVLDYAAGGELFFHLSRLKKFPEATTRFYCAELTLALDELHKHVRIAFFSFVMLCAQSFSYFH